MRRGGWWASGVVVVAALRSAHADDDLGGRVHEGWRPDLVAPPEGAWLHVDPMLRPALEDQAIEVRHRTDWQLGPHTRAVAEGASWTSAGLLDGRGWRASVALVHDVGPFELVLGVSYNGLDTALGRGLYRDVGLSLRRTVVLSRWMTGWISLGIAHRHWEGAGPPPSGEVDATQVMLSIGSTFR